jgi:hypothetical protein
VLIALISKEVCSIHISPPEISGQVCLRNLRKRIDDTRSKRSLGCRELTICGHVDTEDQRKQD